MCEGYTGGSSPAGSAVRSALKLQGRYNKSMPEESTSAPNFEARLEELERIVKELEKGDLPLEQCLALFENGMRLSADCKRQLEEAESRVEMLIRRGSEMIPVPFDPDKGTQ